MKIGDKVRVERMPDGLPPDNKQLQTLFGGCVGKTFPIVAFDGDLVELHVGEVFGKPAEHHQIWLEPSQVKLVEV
ncbi:hypothetical protein [Hyphomicrobium sp.]|jgi:hypothetical protein|uniref:hypothetical protein n=1 Tax=Hyphomicrobium sp. TaxID=82 RepID=UPI002CE341FF|nr:hypothetical protein [Hyphomicrobium sp.]HVZ05556.1 hypothetical protein [Hyphomicrobium sp.]